MYHGKGISKYPDGSVEYEGEWKDDMRHGEGTCNFENGDIYKGEWRADNTHGKGIMNYTNQDIYDGEWKNNYKDGKGTMTFHNGDVYEGEFSNDMTHGKGVFEYAAGDILKSIVLESGRKGRSVACLKMLSELANKSFTMPKKPD